MSRFLSRLHMEAVDDSDSGRWRLTQPLEYASDIGKAVIIVPAGFETDLASTPRLPVIYWLAGNVATSAAVVHDFLYSDGRYTREVADAIFREASAVIGVSGWRRWIMWAGVRLGGGSHYVAG
jgi:subtilisin family serine protease